MTENFALKQMHLKISSDKRQPFQVGFNVLILFASLLTGVDYYLHKAHYSHRPLL